MQNTRLNQTPIPENFKSDSIWFELKNQNFQPCFFIVVAEEVNKESE